MPLPLALTMVKVSGGSRSRDWFYDFKLYEARPRKSDGVYTWRYVKTVCRHGVKVRASRFGRVWHRGAWLEAVEAAKVLGQQNGWALTFSLRHGMPANLSPVELLAAVDIDA